MGEQSIGQNPKCMKRRPLSLATLFGTGPDYADFEVSRRVRSLPTIPVGKK